MIIELQYLICFLLFLILEAFVINGIRECFSEGNIFFKMFGSFIKKHQGKWWSYPMWYCIKCMGSTYGSLLFWVVAYPLFGISYFTLVAWILNCFSLVSLNYLVYKNI
jgi:hypothetical protein